VRDPVTEIPALLRKPMSIIGPERRPCSASNRSEAIILIRGDDYGRSGTGRRCRQRGLWPFMNSRSVAMRPTYDSEKMS